ncbi:MAG: ASCH domain-containing protein [Thermococci archaeon]|nr:ASCH domain-containing protein [Thermococci archaeon]
MKHVEFDGRYLELLLSGKKRGTVRLGRLRIEPGSVVTLHAGGYVVGKALVKDVEYKKVSELTEEDARADGFGSLDELLEALRSHYTRLKEDDVVTVVRFELIEKPERLVRSSEYPYGGHDPLDIAAKALKHLDLDEEDRRVLEIFLREGSIRRTARRIGGVKKRGEVREIIRKAYKELTEKGLL